MTAAGTDPGGQDARLVAFADLVDETGRILGAPWGLVCLAARLVARAPGAMPFASTTPDRLIASIAPAAPPRREDPRVAARIAAIDAIAGRMISAEAQTLGSVEGIWLFAAFTAQIVRAAPPRDRAELVALYERARAI